MKGKQAPRGSKSGSRRDPTETITFLTLDETKRLISAIKNKRDRAIFLIAYRHGLRASEIGLFRRTDFDSKQLQLIIHRKKGSRSGTHPLQPDESKAVKSYLRSRPDSSPVLFLSRRNLPIDRTMLHRLMRKYGELAKLPSEKQHFHVLKHTIATQMLEAGENG